MAIDKEIKKKVTEEWLSAFPQLSAFTQNKLYKVVGSCVIGIELIKSPFSDEFSPYFVIYPLWEKDVKHCFDFPIVLKEFYNKKKLQFNVPYAKNSQFIDEVIESIRLQTPIIFEDNISIKKLLKLLEEHSNDAPLNASKNSYLQAKLNESMLKISLYSDINQFEVYFNKIKSINWNAENFKYFGFEVDNWIKNLERMVSIREDFLNQIEVNKLDKKLLKIKRSEIIP